MIVEFIFLHLYKNNLKKLNWFKKFSDFYIFLKGWAVFCENYIYIKKNSTPSFLLGYFLRSQATVWPLDSSPFKLRRSLRSGKQRWEMNENWSDSPSILRNLADALLMQVQHAENTFYWLDAFVLAFPKPIPVVGIKNVTAGVSPGLEKGFIFCTAISFRPLLDLTYWLLKRPVRAGPNETGGQNKSSYIRMESIHREGHGAGMIVQTTVWLCTFHTRIERVGCTAADEIGKRTLGR